MAASPQALQDLADQHVMPGGIGADEVVPGVFLCGENRGSDYGFCAALRTDVVVCCNAADACPPFAEFAVPRADDADPVRTFPTAAAFVAAVRGAIATEGVDRARPTMFVASIAAQDSPGYDMTPHLAVGSDVIQGVVECSGPLAPAATDDEEPSTAAGRVVVHCLAGVSRSASVVCAYLMRRTQASRDHVLALMRQRRPCVAPNTGFMHQLLRWELAGFGSPEEPGAPARIAERLAAQSPIDRREQFGAYMSTLMLSARCAEECRRFTALFDAVAAAGVFGTAGGVAETVALIALGHVASEEFTDAPRFLPQCALLAHSIARSERLADTDEDIVAARQRIAAGAFLTPLVVGLLGADGDPGDECHIDAARDLLRAVRELEWPEGMGRDGSNGAGMDWSGPLERRMAAIAPAVVQWLPPELAPFGDQLAADGVTAAQARAVRVDLLAAAMRYLDE